MKKLKNLLSGLIFCLLELIVGILLLINPVGFTSWIIQIAGIVLVITGIVDVVKYFTTSTKEASLGQTLAKGLLSVLAGGFCALKTEWFIVTFPVLTVLYGVITLMGGIGKIQMMFDMIRQKNKKWFWAAISAVVSIVCAIVILSSPFTSTAVLWVFTGISLLVEAVLDFFALLFGKKTTDETKEAATEGAVE